VDPTRELLQVRHRIDQSGRDAGQLGSKIVPVGRDIRLRGAHRQSERDQPLLGAVVEVSLDPAASLVRRRDDPPARGGELGAAVRIGDRGCDDVGELLQAFLDVDRQWLVLGCDDDGAPETAVHDDRARNRRDESQAPEACGGRPAGRRPAPLIGAGRAAGAKHLRGSQEVIQLPPLLRLLEPTRTIAGPSGSNLPTAAWSEPNRRPTSSLTAQKISTGRTPCATSVATRRSAACSSASCWRASRDSTFAIAVASSSVKSARRASVPSASCSVLETTIAPQRRPATTIGMPTVERISIRRTASTISPSSPA
jgi:hypothetical protein